MSSAGVAPAEGRGATTAVNATLLGVGGHNHPMAVLLHPSSQAEQWHSSLARLLPEHTVHLWPDPPAPDDVRYLIAWRHDAELVATYRNLKAILCLGAGVEQFIGIAPADVPIVRLVDPAMADEMAVYALHWASHFHRRFDVALAAAGAAQWTEPQWRGAPETRVGILGLGTIGTRIGELFVAAGHPVSGWSRSRHRHPTIDCFAGNAELTSFLGSVEVLVNVLPHTRATEGLIDRERIEALSHGATYINLGRGATNIEDDLLEALDSGQLKAVVLDVLQVEPLGSDSPLWRHPQVRITPHIAGATQVATAAPLIANSLLRLERGESPQHVVAPERGY